jgi:hypothetical protein
VLATRGTTPHPASQDKKISVACSSLPLRIGGETSLFFLLGFPSARVTGSLGIRMHMWTDRSSLGGGFDARGMLAIKEFVRTLHEGFDSCLQVFCILIAIIGPISDLIES